MWVFTPEGFYSVVQKRQDRKKNTLTIRTRNRADIDSLVANHFPKARPYRVDGSDYEWRIRVPKKGWARAVQRMAMDIDYANFKDEVTRRQGWDRHDVYLRVWSALLAISDRPRRRWWGGDSDDDDLATGSYGRADGRPDSEPWVDEYQPALTDFYDQLLAGEEVDDETP